MFFPSLPILSLILVNSYPVLGIIGGKRLTFSYPFFVQVNPGHSYSCGGSIVSHDTIVTAAHCLFDHRKNKWLNERQIAIVQSDFRENRWKSRAKVYASRRYVYHQKFDPSSVISPFDIAIVQVNESFDKNDGERIVLETCTQKYAIGIALGMGLTNLGPNVQAKVGWRTNFFSKLVHSKKISQVS